MTSTTKNRIFEKIASSGIVYLQCSSEGIIRDISENITQYFARSPHWFLNKKVQSFIPAIRRKDVYEQCKQLIHNKSDSIRLILPLGVEKNKLLTFLIAITWYPDEGYFCTLTPATGIEKYSDDSHFRQIEVMRSALESIEDIVFVLDSKGRFADFYTPTDLITGKILLDGFSRGVSLADAGFPDEVEQLILKSADESRLLRKVKTITFSIKAFGGILHYSARISPRFTVNNHFDGVTVVIKDITTSVKSEQKLKSSLDYYLKVLDNFPNPILRINTYRNVDYVNSTWVQFTGIEINKQLGTGWTEAVHPDDREGVRIFFDLKFGDRKAFEIEYRLKHHTNSFRWVINFWQPLLDIKGRFNGYIGSCFDIDEILSTQKLLQESESRYRAMVQEQSDLVLRWNKDLSITFVNRSFCNFFGKTSDELIGANWISKFPFDQRDGITVFIESFIRKGESGFFETEIVRPDNKLVVYQWLSTPVSDKNGRIIEYQSVGRDITERIVKEKENQLLLQQLKSRLNELILLNKLSEYFNQGLDESVLFAKLATDISDSVSGIGKVSTVITHNSATYKCNPDIDASFFQLFLHYFGENKQGKLEVLFSETFTPGHIDNEFSQSINVLLTTVCEMLTSYLQKQEWANKLLQSEARYSELFENVPDIVFQVDPNGKILKINSAATRILQYTSFENKNLWEYAPPSERVSIVSLVNKIFSKKRESFSFETKVLSKVGSMIYLQTACIVKYNADGLPLEIFGIARDITAQKKMNQNLMKTIISTEEKERRRFAEDIHDGIGPLLSGLKMYLQKDSLAKGIDENQERVLKYCREIVDDAINQTRSIANNLTPGILNDFGLEKALVSHVAKINALEKFKVNLTIESSLKTVENEISLAVYRVITELLNNSLKYAGCTLVEIVLDIKQQILTLRYHDNGKGFDSQPVSNEQSRVKMGLRSIQNRVNALNGSFTIRSKDGEGVSVKIFLPLHSAH